MLSFDEVVVSVKIRGEQADVRKPCNGDIEEYTKALKEADTDELQGRALIDFLAKLGLPEHLFKKLTPAQVKTLLEELYSSEKN